MLNNDLPRTIKDVPYRYAYEGKKVWTVLGTNKRLVGILHLNDENINLEFEAPRDEVDGYKGKNLAKTTGIDRGSSRITLLGSSVWESPFSGFLKTGPGKMRLSPSLAIVQAGMRPTIDQITNLTGYLPGIAEWFKEDFLGFDYGEYKFKQPKTIYHKIPIGDFAEISLNAKLTIDTDNVFVEGKFVAYPESFVRIEFKKQNSIRGAINLFSHVENFFNFIFSSPHATHIFTSELKDKKPPGTPLYILSPQRHKDYRREDRRFQGSMLFSWDQVSNINDVFVRWILEYDRIHEIVDALVLLKATRVSEEMRFTSIINALEAVHRRYYDHKTEPDDKYKARVEKIVQEVVDEPNKELVSKRLEYGNEISLRTRLKEVYAIGEVHGMQKPAKKVTDKIIETRNYLTHGDEARKQNMLRPGSLEFINANSTLSAYLKLILLQIIGVTQADLTEIVKSSPQFQSYYRDEPPSKNPYIF